MVKICAVKSCTSRRKNKTKIRDVSSVSFFQPTSQARLQEWSQSLGISLKPSDFVCQLHFKKEDIKLNYKIISRNNGHYHNLRKKILKRHAVPTVEYQEQHYPVKHEAEEEQEIREEKQRNLKQGQGKRSESRQALETTQPIAYLKRKFSVLPEYWLYVERPNEIEFMRIDHNSKKIRNHIVLKEDFSIVVIGSNNKKIYLDDKLTSPDDIYDYLKYVEEWTACVGTRIQTQTYSKQCDGVIFYDKSPGNNYPRCKPCKLLRCRLQNRIITLTSNPESSTACKLRHENILKQRLRGIHKPVIMDDYKAEDFLEHLDRIKEIIGQEKNDINNLDWLKEKMQMIGSSSEFCGLCYNDGHCCPINTELIINRQKFSKCLRDIVNYVFNDDAANLMSSPFICDSCIEKTIQSYIFMHNTKQIARIMDKTISDLYSKIMDIGNQLSPTLEYDNANVMIVLENDSVLQKSIINTKIKEIVQISVPIPMKTESSEISAKSMKVIPTNSQKRLNNENPEIDLNLRKIPHVNSNKKSKKDDLDFDTKQPEFDPKQPEFDINTANPDNSESSFMNTKITQFFPTAIPMPKKVQLKPKKQLHFVSSSTPKVSMRKESPNIDTKMTYAISDISMIKDLNTTDPNIIIITPKVTDGHINIDTPKFVTKATQMHPNDTPTTTFENSRKFLIDEDLLQTPDTPDTPTNTDNEYIRTIRNLTLKKGQITIKPSTKNPISNESIPMDLLFGLNNA